MNRKYAFGLAVISAALLTIFFFPQFKYQFLGWLGFLFACYFGFFIHFFLVKKLEPIYREVFPKTHMNFDALVNIVFLLSWISLTGYLINKGYEFFYK